MTVILENKDLQARLEKLERLGRQVRLALLDQAETPERRAVLVRQDQEVRKEKMELLAQLDQ